LSAVEYPSLGYPDAMSHLPDFTVMNREQTSKQFGEVKYRTHWGKNLFDDVREQVRLFGEIVLVSVNARAKDPRAPTWTERAPGAWPAPSVAPQAKLPVPRRLALVRNRVQVRWRATRAGPRIEMPHPFVERLTLAAQALRTER
jgi:hypothetical protein